MNTEDFGSLTNAILASDTSPTPTVGMGATLLSYSDRSPATVVWVSKSGKTIHLQEDNYHRTDSFGMSDMQDYIYTRNTDNPVVEARLTRKGWKVVKGQRVKLGVRERYYDYTR